MNSSGVLLIIEMLDSIDNGQNWSRGGVKSGGDSQRGKFWRRTVHPSSFRKWSLSLSRE